MPGRNLRFGVREHAMGGIANGIAYHGGFLPYAATFLTFSDYMRGSVRLAALSGLHVTYVWTHDSVGLGEDGPTHQPVEHYAALRAIPNLWFVRPGRRQRGGRGVGARGRAAGGRRGAVGPGRAGVHPPEAADARRARRSSRARASGGAATSSARRAAATPQLILIGTGSELQLCVTAAEALEADGIPTRVVSLPCWERFDAQDQTYRDRVLPPAVRKRVSVEAGDLARAGSAGSATRARSSASTTSARAPRPARSSRSSGSRRSAWPTSGDGSSATGSTAGSGRSASPHGEHPTLETGDSGTDRTPSSDPGHD